jgi:multidrug resistance efflux pump
VLPWLLWGAAALLVFVQRHDLARTAISPGVVSATTIDVRASHTGRVVELHKAVGDTVAPDDIVIMLSSPELDAQVAIARAEFTALESAVLATDLDVKDADRELLARLGQDLEQATVDVARFQRELDEARAGRVALSTQLERLDGLIARGLATTEDKAELESNRHVLQERETTTAALIAAARVRESRAQQRVNELIASRRPSKADAGADEARVGAARAEATSKQSEVTALEALRDTLAMKTGVAGTVTDVFVVDGGPVVAGDVLLRVVQTGKLRVSAWFEETQARSVHVGDRVMVGASDGASHPREGKIVSLAAAIGETPERFRFAPNQPRFARAALIELVDKERDGDAALLAGMAVDVRVVGR